MRLNDIYLEKSINSKVTYCEYEANTNVCDIEFKSIRDQYILVSEKDIKLGYVKTNFIKEINYILNNCIFDCVLNSIDDGVIIVNSKGLIIYANKAYSEILGIKLNRIIGRNINRIESEATIIKVLNEKIEIKKKNNFIKSLNKYVNVDIKPLYIDDKFIGAISIFNDITVIKELDEKARRAIQIAEERKKEIKAHKIMDQMDIIGSSPNYMRLISTALSIAKTDASILITGENGTGKDVICNFIHKNSDRSNKAFVTLNCAAIPENLIESEMFGYLPGAFTGALNKGKIGKFELANNGTIFLDEIGEMSLKMQAKLLRVLENGEIQKIASHEKTKIDVRVIAATNQNLEEKIKEGKFREDLYYRLNVINLEVPPLRDRLHDLLLLSDHFLNYYMKKYKKRLKLSNSVIDIFQKYDWPGNIRQLKNCIEHCVILAENELITEKNLPIKLKKYNVIGDTSLNERVKKFEKKIITETIELNNGNIKESAKQLKISVRTLYRKLN
ncbi:MAG: sigma 54-interacting transcriptional regulator [Tissierellia bacterium]|nr:sigma 54-interacting transcriptional regulator [Tissierellia bacterium]